jgi:hypothetical protein
MDFPFKNNTTWGIRKKKKKKDGRKNACELISIAPVLMFLDVQALTAGMELAGADLDDRGRVRELDEPHGGDGEARDSARARDGAVHIGAQLAVREGLAAPAKRAAVFKQRAAVIPVNQHQEMINNFPKS